MTRARLRDLEITVGRLPTGPYNAITDVPEILVGHRTLVYDEPRIARTGVTVILPRQGQIWQDNAFAACHAFNGTGEMTGMHWLAESGMLCYPVALTTTHHIGTVHEALVAYGQENGLTTQSFVSSCSRDLGWLPERPGRFPSAEGRRLPGAGRRQIRPGGGGKCGRRDWYDLP